MQIMIAFLNVISLSLIILCGSAQAQQESWSHFLAGLRAEAIEQNISPDLFDRAFQGIRAPNPKVLRYDRTQPEKRLTFLKYRKTRGDAYRIKLGRRELKKHSALLSQVSRYYGVSECFIVSIWGLETSYGRFMGSFPVIHSLATLAYNNNRRAAFFRKQLFLALHILNDGHVDLKDFKGEWAGASGHPQFLPSSFHHYAVDHDNDGRKDIWRNLPDVFASIANYLHKNGWQPGEPWVVPVTVPAHFDKSLMGRKIKKSVQAWADLGVRAQTGALPNTQGMASIIYPHGGPALMIFNNFNVLMTWNRSTYYAGTVSYMAEQICRRSPERLYRNKQ